MKPLRLAVAALAVFLASAGAATAGTPQGTITSITPASGPTAGGTSVEITGTWLWGASGPTVTIGGVTATEVSHSGYPGGPELITVRTPAHAAGAVDVVVSEYGYERARTDGGFTYVDPAPVTPSATGPAVTAITPASGLTTGGEAVTITGARFSGETAPTVTIGGTAATDVTVVNDTTLTATTPAHAAGAADVTVARGAEGGTLSGGYTFNQGYWLTVNSTRPANIGTLTSTGAVRSPAFGDWATNTVGTGAASGIFGKAPTTTTHTGYAGGINCGARTVSRRVVLLFTAKTEESWSAGACKYAFPAGAKVDLSALPSSSNSDLIPGLSLSFQSGFLGTWRNDCSASTTGTCSLQMTANRTVGATWGFINMGILGIIGNVVYPTYNSSGELQYYDSSVLMVAPPQVTGGTPFYFAYFTVPAKAAGATEQGAATARTKVVCRSAAHLTGRRLSARCNVTPWLASALKHGSVRATITWYVRLPHSSALQPISRGHAMLRGRRTSAITG